MLISTISTFIGSALLLPFVSAAPAPANLTTRAVPLPSYARAQPAILFPYYTTPWNYKTGVIGGSYGAPLLKVKINGRESYIHVDTGNTGVMVAAHMVPNFSPTGLRKGFRFFQTYSADGYWMPAVKIALTDSTGREHEVTTPVFVITETSRCIGPTGDPSTMTECPAASKSDTVKDSDNAVTTLNRFPPIMGIGWDVTRIATGLTGSFDTINVMHQIAMRPPARTLGFVLTRNGIYAGLDSTVTRNFKVQKLRSNSATNKDLAWVGFDGRISRVGGNGRRFGVRVIFQLCFQAAYIVTLPTAADFPLGEGTSRAIVLTEVLDETNGSVMASYQSRPSNSDTYLSDSKPVIRIGAQALETRDFMYDAANGYAGFRPV